MSVCRNYKTMKAMQMHRNPNNTLPISILSPSDVDFEPEPASALELGVASEALAEPTVVVLVPLAPEVDTDDG